MNGLRDVVISISEVELDDEGQPYAVNTVLHYDLAGTADDVVRLIDAHQELFVEGGQMIHREEE